MTITDLGVLHKTASLNVYLIFKYSTENVYSLYPFWYPDWNTPMNLLSLNHDTDAVTICEGPSGRPYSNFVHPTDGMTYVATDRGTANPGEYGKWDHRTGTYTALGVVPRAADGTQWGTYSDETPSRLFYGSNRKGGLHAHGESQEDFGILDDPGAYPDVRYIPSLQVDSSYAYCTVYEPAAYGTPGFRLCIVTLSDQTQTLKWKGIAGQTSMAVYRGTNESIYVKRIVSGVTTWWLCDGINDPGEVSEPAVHALAWAGRGDDSPIDYDPTGYAADSSRCYPDADKLITLLYKRTGDTDYREKDTTLLTVADFQTMRAFINQDGNLWSSPESYAPIQQVTLPAGTLSRLGVLPTSTNCYSFLWDGLRGWYWLTGYPAGSFYKLDPTIDPFEDGLTAITGLPDIGPPAIAQYYYFTFRGSDSLIWSGTNYARSNPYTVAMTYYDPDLDTSDHVAYENYSLGGVDLNLARNKVVLSLYDALNVTQGYWKVIPVWKKEASKTLTPLGVAANQGRPICVCTSKATTNHFVGMVSGANHVAFCVDIGTGTLIWGPTTYSGKTQVMSVYNQTMSFKHGLVWFYRTGLICSLDPTDGTVAEVLAVSYAGQHTWDSAGNFMYHWDSTSKHMYKIPKADLWL